MLSLKTVIFDCDGVLFESHRANLAYYNRIFIQFDYPPITDPLSAEAHICHTESSSVVLSRLMAADKVEAALQFADSIDYREFVSLMFEAPGLDAALSLLSAKMPLAVATNRGRSVQEVLKHFELAHHFSTVVTSRDVAAPKPAPDMLLLAAERLGIPVVNCLFVGDSELDHQAAKAIQMPFVAYGELVDVDRCVGSHAELVDFVLKNAGLI